MDFTPTEEQEAVRGLAVSLLATAKPAELGLDGFDVDLWARLGESGLLGIALPQEQGGGGLGLAEAAVLAEETGRAAARVPVVAALAGVQALSAAAQPRHDELVQAVVAARALVVPALAEAGVGDPRRPSVRATRSQDGWLLSGQRLAVAWAREASHLVVAASTPEDEVLLVLLPTGAAGVTLEDEDVSSKEPHATVLLDDARVGDDDVLASGEDAVAALEQAITRNTLLQCAYAVGLGEEALRMAAAHVSQREQFGKALATFQAIALQLADSWIDVEAMRLTTQQAVWRVDAGLPAAEETAVAAFWGADAGDRVALCAVHLHGGLGVDVSYPLHRWFLAAKVTALSLGGAQRQLEELGRSLATR